jgi:hypothetical protein
MSNFYIPLIEITPVEMLGECVSAFDQFSALMLQKPRNIETSFGGG